MKTNIVIDKVLKDIAKKGLITVINRVEYCTFIRLFFNNGISIDIDVMSWGDVMLTLRKNGKIFSCEIVNVKTILNY